MDKYENAVKHVELDMIMSCDENYFNYTQMDKKQESYLNIMQMKRGIFMCIP